MFVIVPWNSIDWWNSSKLMKWKYTMKSNKKKCSQSHIRRLGRKSTNWDLRACVFYLQIVVHFSYESKENAKQSRVKWAQQIDLNWWFCPNSMSFTSLQWQLFELNVRTINRKWKVVSRPQSDLRSCIIEQLASEMQIGFRVKWEMTNEKEKMEITCKSRMMTFFLVWSIVARWKMKHLKCLLFVGDLIEFIPSRLTVYKSHAVALTQNMILSAQFDRCLIGKCKRYFRLNLLFHL